MYGPKTEPNTPRGYDYDGYLTWITIEVHPLCKTERKEAAGAPVLSVLIRQIRGYFERSGAVNW